MKNPENYTRANTLGRQWEDRVYAELKRFNPAILQPPKPDEWAEDYGDIRVDLEIICKRRLKLRFTCREDYPFSTVYVNEQYKMAPDYMTREQFCSLPFDQQLCVMKWFHSCWVASADMSHVALVIPGTKPFWVLESKWSPEDNRTKPNATFACPKEKVLFSSVKDMQWMMKHV